MKDNLRGSILIVVLWATVGLVSVSLLFGHSMLMSYRGADNEFAGRQADQAIEGAIRYAEMLLTNAETPGTFPELTSYLGESVPVGEATFWFVGRSLETTDGTVREYALVDEASKINLNTADAGKLRLLPGMTEDIATAIDEWRKASGAGGAIGSVSSRGSEVKHAQFESAEELALVPGMTRTILYGEDANMNGVLDPNEDDGEQNDPPDNSDGKLDPGIIEYVTVFTKEPTTDANDEPRVDLAQPNQLTGALGTMLSDTLGANRQQQIVASLGGNPTFNSPLDFYVQSHADPNGITEEEFGQIVGNLMILPPGQTAPTGLVNVNTASESVLAALLGAGNAGQASQIVAARRNRAKQDNNIAWLADVLGPQLSTTIGPFITGQSWQITADVAAVGRFGRGYRREKAVIDFSTQTPRVVYRRNLAPLGWALGGEVREQLAQNREVR